MTMALHDGRPLLGKATVEVVGPKRSSHTTACPAYVVLIRRSTWIFEACVWDHRAMGLLDRSRRSTREEDTALELCLSAGRAFDEIYGPSIEASPVFFRNVESMLLLTDLYEGPMPDAMEISGRLFYALRVSEETRATLPQAKASAERWRQRDATEADDVELLFSEAKTWAQDHFFDLFTHGPDVWKRVVRLHAPHHNRRLREEGFSKWDDDLLSLFGRSLYSLRAVESACGLSPRYFSDGWGQA